MDLLNNDEKVPNFSVFLYISNEAEQLETSKKVC